MTTPAGWVLAQQPSTTSPTPQVLRGHGQAEGGPLPAAADSVSTLPLRSAYLTSAIAEHAAGVSTRSDVYNLAAYGWAIRAPMAPQYHVRRVLQRPRLHNLDPPARPGHPRIESEHLAHHRNSRRRPHLRGVLLTSFLSREVVTTQNRHERRWSHS